MDKELFKIDFRKTIQKKRQIFFLIKQIIVIFAFLIMSSNSNANQGVKRPNVSGQFYDSSPRQLSESVDKFLSNARGVKAYPGAKVIISPHAGYVYSGSVAAYGYQAVKQNKYKTIIILAPSHYFGFDGFSIGLFDHFETPLGPVKVDQGFSKRVIELNDKASFEPRAFEREHSLEVQIPFLQKTFQEFQIVPIIIGHPGFDQIKSFATNLAKIVGKREDVLIVVSTDMSHFHEDALARKMDKDTMEAVEELDAERIFREVQAGAMELCGVYPVVAALYYAQLKDLNNVDILKYMNSSEISGDFNRVVGYFSAVIYKEVLSGAEGLKTQPKENEDIISNSGTGLDSSQKKKLIEIAKEAINSYVKEGKKLQVKELDPRLKLEEGAFVTIHKKGQLRGCIGNIIGRGPLYLTVRDMAISAASQDPRFPKVTVGELDQIEVEISVLSKPRQINDAEEIIMGKHGVIVSRGPFHHGVFLPQVADSTGWSKEMFLSQLCSQKAGLSPDAWKDPKTKLEIFTADVFSEQDFK